MTKLVQDLLAERQRVRTEMGGEARVTALRANGGRTARDWIDGFIDPGSFMEMGTFVQPERKDQRGGSPGDGKIGGHARVAGRPVSVGADDLTVKAGTDAAGNKQRMDRIYHQAIDFGNPFVYFGQAAGSRIPDILGAERMSRGGGVGATAERRRRIPMAMAIVGRSYGESSFNSSLSDFVVQVRGSTLAVTSPRVIEMATAEAITEEELGGVDVHAEKTGQIDLGVETGEEAIAALQNFLSYLPDNSRHVPERLAAPERRAMPELRKLVPEERRRGYDMRKVVAQLVDGGKYLELRPRFGRSLLTMLARFDGRTVGVMASQPMFQGGAMTPDACDKATRFVLLCDSFNIPMVFLADTPGFLVGRQVEHSRLLYKAVMLNQALVQARVPRVTFILRKAYGLAYFSMSGGRMGSTLMCGWPTAEISFMDPEVAANVVYAPALAKLPEGERKAEQDRLAAELKRGTSAYEAATMMGIDEIVDPAETPLLIAEALDRMMASYDPVNRERTLNSWPTCF